MRTVNEEQRKAAQERSKGLFHWTDGIVNVRRKEQPEGFWRGITLKKESTGFFNPQTKRRSFYKKGSFLAQENGGYSKKVTELEYQRILREAGIEIPVDEFGKPYHVHHKDGNPLNNNLDNLELIKGKEHAEKHQNGSYFRRYSILYTLTNKSYSVSEMKKEFDFPLLPQCVRTKIKGRWIAKGVYQQVSGIEHARRSRSITSQKMLDTLENCIIGDLGENKPAGIGSYVKYQPIIHVTPQNKIILEEV